MSNFYYLATALPALKIGETPDITFEEYVTMLVNNLSSGDYRQIMEYRLYFDLQNIRALSKGEEFDFHANLNEKQLEEELVEHEKFPDYVTRYLEEYPEKNDRMKHFPELLAAYFRDESHIAKGLLKQYLAFERELRLVMVGFRAKRLGRDIIKELQFENPDEDLISQLIAQKDAKDFEPPEGFEDLKAIFEKYQDKPYALHQALVEFRFDKVQELMGLKTFNMDYIMGYTIQLVMVEKWLKLDKQKGLEIVDKIVKGTT